MKMLHFLKQNLTNDDKWILYNNMEWKKSLGKWNEPTPITPKGQSSSKEGDVVYMMGLEGCPLVWVPSEKLQIISNKHGSQLDHLKVALNNK